MVGAVAILRAPNAAQAHPEPACIAAINAGAPAVCDLYPPHWKEEEGDSWDSTRNEWRSGQRVTCHYHTVVWYIYNRADHSESGWSLDRTVRRTYRLFCTNPDGSVNT